MRRGSIIMAIAGLLAACGMPHVHDPRETFSSASAVEAADALTVVFVDVGQGDAALILEPAGGQALLIDAGPVDTGAPAVLSAMARHGVKTLTAIIATHYHADHIGGIPGVIRGRDGIRGTTDDIVPQQGIFDRGGTYDTGGPTWQDYAATAGPMRRSLSAGDRIDLGDVSVAVVAVRGETSDGESVPPDLLDENGASVGLVIEYGTFRLFIGGDLTGGGGTPPYDTADVETHVGAIVGDVDAMKVNHHGSATSTNESFLAALSPEIAVISCGNGNDYFHPHPSVIGRLLDADIAVYQTERCWTPHEADVVIAAGDIVIKTDGSSPPQVTLP